MFSSPVGKLNRLATVTVQGVGDKSVIVEYREDNTHEVRFFDCLGEIKGYPPFICHNSEIGATMSFAEEYLLGEYVLRN